jgi:helicase
MAECSATLVSQEQHLCGRPVAERDSGRESFAYLKIADPGERVAPVSPDTDLRVLLPEGDDFTVMQEKLVADGAQVRRVRYLLEEGRITGMSAPSADDQLVAISRLCRLNQLSRSPFTQVSGGPAAAARDAFDLMWHDHAPGSGAAATSMPASAIVPAELTRFLPFQELNPAQAKALPEIFAHDQNLFVVAPTGAGKTVIGMAAVLRAVVQQGHRAVWLVPQRSLTDELDSELAAWRGHGLRVERLSGEHTVDIERIHDADLWVATTEKFEAICRTSAFRDSLAGVRALVVDEIHMLGDPARGPLLEALLARIRDGDIPTRIVGLSATVSNAEQIADWLHATLLRVTWRPSRLTWQLPAIPAHSDFAVTEAARIRLTAAIAGLITADGGSVLVFCGSKRNVRRTALVIAAAAGIDVSRTGPDDLERLHHVCQQARIGLHYQGWEHRRAAEQAFRRRELDILIATSTVAAGVNLPARAVVVQDTQIGLEPLDVATVQQMFGRAGRIGAGENEGWAFMVVDERERAGWQARLIAGHAVHSRIQNDLPEHVLSEAVQQRVTTRQQAEHWWMQTLACHQGQRSLSPLRKAIGFLGSAEMLMTVDTDDGRRLVPTELGRLTARLMVSPAVGADMRSAVASAPIPASAEQAEAVLIEVLATIVPKLARARVGDDGKAALARLLTTAGHTARMGPRGLPRQPERGFQPGDLARAAMLTVARSPESGRSAASPMRPCTRYSRRPRVTCTGSPARDCLARSIPAGRSWRPTWSCGRPGGCSSRRAGQAGCCGHVSRWPLPPTPPRRYPGCGRPPEPGATPAPTGRRADARLNVTWTTPGICRFCAIVPPGQRSRKSATRSDRPARPDRSWSSGQVTSTR